MLALPGPSLPAGAAVHAGFDGVHVHRTGRRDRRDGRLVRPAPPGDSSRRGRAGRRDHRDLEPARRICCCPSSRVTLLSIEGGQRRAPDDGGHRRRRHVHRRRRGARARFSGPTGSRARSARSRNASSARLLRIVASRRRSPAGRTGSSDFRQDTVGLIRRRWLLLTLAAMAGNLAVFLVLLVSLRAVGIELERGDVDRGVRRVVARARAAAHPADARRRRAGRARADRASSSGSAAPTSRSSPRCWSTARSRCCPRCCSGWRPSARGAGSGPMRDEEGVDEAAVKRPAGEGAEPQGRDVGGAPR